MGRLEDDNTRNRDEAPAASNNSNTYASRWVNREQIERAKEIAVLDYVLKFEPNNVTREGSEYRLKDHDSLTISNGKWNWRSRGVGGKTATALNFLIIVRGYNFVDAVRELTDGFVLFRSVPQHDKSLPITQQANNSIENRSEPDKSERQRLVLPPRNGDNRRVIAYLQSRGIDKELILDCINRGDLYESVRYHNCVFLGRDEYGKTRFAAMRGTSGNFKRDADGSDKRFGFTLLPENHSSSAVAVFEAPADCLSYQTLCKAGYVEPFDGWFLSLGGTALAALKHFLECHAGIKDCLVCTDNDEAGNSAAARIAELPGITVKRAIPITGKDWNEALLALQKAERTQSHSTIKESR